MGTCEFCRKPASPATTGVFSFPACVPCALERVTRTLVAAMQTVAEIGAARPRVRPGTMRDRAAWEYARSAQRLATVAARLAREVSNG